MRNVCPLSYIYETFVELAINLWKWNDLLSNFVHVKYKYLWWAWMVNGCTMYCPAKKVTFTYNLPFYTKTLVCCLPEYHSWILLKLCDINTKSHVILCQCFFDPIVKGSQNVLQTLFKVGVLGRPSGEAIYFVVEICNLKLRIFYPLFASNEPS